MDVTFLLRFSIVRRSDSGRGILGSAACSFGRVRCSRQISPIFSRKKNTDIYTRGCHELAVLFFA